jgi:protein-tyrosine phosphatase
MAEAIVRRMAGRTVRVESAGLEAAEGMPPTAHAVAVMSERGANIRRHRSRSVQSVDLSQYDVVIAMKPWITDGLRKLGVKTPQVFSLDVDDPYGKGIGEYRDAAAEIERAVQILLPRLRPAA